MSFLYSGIFKHLNIRHNTIKLPEENIGKTFSDINHKNVFLGQSPKAIEIKTKINKGDLIKLTSIAEEITNKMTTYRTGENISQWCDWQGLIFQNIQTDQTAHITQKQPNQKKDRRAKHTCLQTRNTNGKQTHEDVQHH